MIPDINRKEWGDLLTDTIQPSLSSLSLQMKLNSLRFAVKYDKIDLRDAIVDLHRFCSSNVQMYQNDIRSIFR